MDFPFRGKSGRAADITAKTDFDPFRTSGVACNRFRAPGIVYPRLIRQRPCRRDPWQTRIHPASHSAHRSVIYFTFDAPQIMFRPKQTGG
jgi:hypothetical protein